MVVIVQAKQRVRVLLMVEATEMTLDDVVHFSVMQGYFRVGRLDLSGELLGERVGRPVGSRHLCTSP